MKDSLSHNYTDRSVSNSAVTAGSTTHYRSNYDILERVATLKPSTESKTKYHCPVCDGDDLDIHPQTGAYSCFSNNCDSKDIRVAIDKREGKPDWKP